MAVSLNFVSRQSLVSPPPEISFRFDAAFVLLQLYIVQLMHNSFLALFFHLRGEIYELLQMMLMGVVNFKHF